METINYRQSLFILPENKGALHELKQNFINNELISFKLMNKKKITHDTFIFTFELPKDMFLGLNLGNHISIEYLVIFN